MQHRVDVPLEDTPGVGGPQQPARSHQERGADLFLEPLQAAGHPRLADLVDLGDLGDGGTVSDLLEEPEYVGVHKS